MLGMMLDPLWLGWETQGRMKQSSALQELIFLREIQIYKENISVDLREFRARGMHKMLWKCREAAFRRVFKELAQ